METDAILRPIILSNRIRQLKEIIKSRENMRNYTKHDVDAFTTTFVERNMKRLPIIKKKTMINEMMKKESMSAIEKLYYKLREELNHE